MAHNSQNNFIFHFTFYIFHFSLVKVGLLVELIVLILPMAHNSQQKPPRLDLTNNSTQLNTIALIFGRYIRRFGFQHAPWHDDCQRLPN